MVPEKMIEWRWKCKNCAHEFMLSPARMPAPCTRCGGEWFLKVGETDDGRDEERENESRDPAFRRA